MDTWRAEAGTRAARQVKEKQRLVVTSMKRQDVVIGKRSRRGTVGLDYRYLPGAQSAQHTREKVAKIGSSIMLQKTGF